MTLRLSTALASLGFASFAHAATLTVTSTADNTTAGDGLCTLREAVQEATLLAGVGPYECGTPTLAGSDTIVMGAAVAGQTISLASQLTFFNDGAIIIQGSDIVIDGTGLGVVLAMQSDGNQLRDLWIQNGGTAIEVRSTADGTIIGGTTAADRVHIDDATSYGIRVVGASNTTIRKTRIADSDRNIQIEAGSSGVDIMDNCILGLDPNGAASASDSEIGVYISGGSSITIRNSTISDNGFGIAAFGGDGLVVRSNAIGTNAAGTAARSNGTAIFVGGTTTNVLIGGTTAASGNLVSGNDLAIGVFAVDGVDILNNLIGTNAAGVAIIENGDGIILNSATNTVIQGNVIGGQRHAGVYVDGGSSALLTYNLIGTNAALGNLPNGRVSNTAGVVITGAATLVANTIAFHDEFAGSEGIYVADTGTIEAGSIDNCISDNDIGLTDDSSGDIHSSSNYWGDPDGPTILPFGAVEGDSIDEVDGTGLLDYSSHLGVSSVPCP